MSTAKTNLQNALSALVGTNLALRSVRALLAGDSGVLVANALQRAENELESARSAIEAAQREIK